MSIPSIQIQSLNLYKNFDLKVIVQVLSLHFCITSSSISPIQSFSDDLNNYRVFLLSDDLDSDNDSDSSYTNRSESDEEPG